ncbi:hypothetical protein A2U01_0079338, partial [Trifolium medium]|nr:hypothetical protein [Trifolium medium]
YRRIGVVSYRYRVTYRGFIGGMQQKGPGSIMRLYIYGTKNDNVKDFLKRRATEIAANNGYTVTFLDKDPFA